MCRQRDLRRSAHPARCRTVAGGTGKRRVVPGGATGHSPGEFTVGALSNVTTTQLQPRPITACVERLRAFLKMQTFTVQKQLFFPLRDTSAMTCVNFPRVPDRLHKNI